MNLVDQLARRVDDDVGALLGTAATVPGLGRIVVVDAPGPDVEKMAVELGGAEAAVGVLVAAQVQVEEVGEQPRVQGDGHVPDQVHLVQPLFELKRLLVHQLRPHALNQLEHGLVQGGQVAHGLEHVGAVLVVARAVARQHEPAQVLFPREQGVDGLQPGDGELLGAAERLLDGGAGEDDDGLRRRLGVVERVLVHGAELPGNLLVDLLGEHGLHDGQRVEGEPAGKAALDQLVHHGAAERLVVVLHLVVAPARQVRDGVVEGVEPVGAHQRDGVGENGAANRVRRAAAAGVADGLGVLDDEAGIELHHVRVRVQLLEQLRNVRVGADVAKRLVPLESEELAELVERRNLPLAGLDDAENLDHLERLGDCAGAKGAGRILHGLVEDANKVLVLEGAVGLAHEAAKRAGAGLGRLGLEVDEGSAEVAPADILQVFRLAAREELEEEVVDPALVLLGDAGVEAVQQVELDADLVADAARRPLAVKLLVDVDARVQRPVAVGVVRVGDGPQVVVQRYVDVQPADDQTGRVEEVVVLLGHGHGPVLLVGVGPAGQREAPVLVDLEQDVAHIVVEAAVEDQHDVDARGLAEQTLLVERVGLQLALLHGADLQLVPERRAVQGGQVEVRRRVRLVRVRPVGVEDVVDDDGCVVQEHGREAGLVLLEVVVVASHQEVEEQPRIGLDPLKPLRGADRLGVRRARPAQVGLQDIVEAPVRSPVLMEAVWRLRDALTQHDIAVRDRELDRVVGVGLSRGLGPGDNLVLDIAADVAQGRMLEIVPKRVDELVGEKGSDLGRGREGGEDADQELGRATARQCCPDRPRCVPTHPFLSSMGAPLFSSPLMRSEISVTDTLPRRPSQSFKTSAAILRGSATYWDDPTGSSAYASPSWNFSSKDMVVVLSVWKTPEGILGKPESGPPTPPYIHQTDRTRLFLTPQAREDDIPSLSRPTCRWVIRTTSGLDSGESSSSHAPSRPCKTSWLNMHDDTRFQS
ncbi:hypothetical protein G6O67_008753 [Ophiocordyceps sinensis]|uniref:Uncharacterized protein n=1 Tax=Ophiocordyceps sinensis TaxID=72228 RepID=A0A8H4PFP3_9HYPO|nr:hypothetical protein G6O67_008753 [Ophiocordyceps sinensis]